MVFKSLIPSVTAANLSDYLEDIIEYYDQFKVFATPFETLYPAPPCLDLVDRVYNAHIEDEDITGDSVYNVSFRFMGSNGLQHYAYAHMRINYGYDIEEEFIRGTMFVTTKARLFFMTTIWSIEETDELHSFLLQDGLNISFNQHQLPLAAHVSLANYALQINSV